MAKKEPGFNTISGVSLEEQLGGDSPVFTGKYISGRSNTIVNLPYSAFSTDTVNSVLKAVYPIGSIYINATNDTNPATLLGFGTWEAFGAGRVMVGLDSGDTDFDTAEETGGAKTVTLTAAQSGVPAHTHSLTSQVLARGADGSGSNNTATSGTRSVSVATALDNTAADAASAHTNVQPYIVVYMWKRTA